MPQRAVAQRLLWQPNGACFASAATDSSQGLTNWLCATRLDLLCRCCLWHSRRPGWRSSPSPWRPGRRGPCRVSASKRAEATTCPWTAAIASPPGDHKNCVTRCDTRSSIARQSPELRRACQLRLNWEQACFHCACEGRRPRLLALAQVRIVRSISTHSGRLASGRSESQHRRARHLL